VRRGLQLPHALGGIDFNVSLRPKPSVPGLLTALDPQPRGPDTGGRPIGEPKPGQSRSNVL